MPYPTGGLSLRSSVQHVPSTMNSSQNPDSPPQNSKTWSSGVSLYFYTSTLLHSQKSLFRWPAHLSTGRISIFPLSQPEVFSDFHEV